MATATTTEPPPWLIRATDLACQRGERLLFQHLDLALPPGQVLWVRGPNGRGKTSLLRLLAGLSQPAAGAVERARAPLYIGHQHALKDDLSALEALAFLAQLHGQASDKATLLDALARMGVQGQRRAAVRTLSQGQKRRVALARLWLSPSDTPWILDEPFDALDAQGVATLNAVLQSHRQGGGAVVLTSHQALDLPAVVSLDLASLPRS